jgi:hypothetical protein
MVWISAKTKQTNAEVRARPEQGEKVASLVPIEPENTVQNSHFDSGHLERCFGGLKSSKNLVFTCSRDARG